MRREGESLAAALEREKGSVEKVRKLRESLEAARLEMAKAERAYDLNTVAELRHGKIPQLEAELKKLEKAGTPPRCSRRGFSGGDRRGRRQMDGRARHEVLEGEKEKLLRLEDVLHQRVIGQDEAVTLVTEAILRARSGIKDPRRPVGSFLSSAPPVLAKPSWRRRSRRPCSTPRRRWSVSTCRSTWRSTASPV